jgi:hypothetical protein
MRHHYKHMDESRLRDPSVVAANWWRIAQHEARLAVLRRLGLPEDLASSPWQEIGPGFRDQISRETVPTSGT